MHLAEKFLLLTLIFEVFFLFLEVRKIASISTLSAQPPSLFPVVRRRCSFRRNSREVIRKNSLKFLLIRSGQEVMEEQHNMRRGFLTIPVLFLS